MPLGSGNIELEYKGFYGSSQTLLNINHQLLRIPWKFKVLWKAFFGSLTARNGYLCTSCNGYSAMQILIKPSSYFLISFPNKSLSFQTTLHVVQVLISHHKVSFTTDQQTNMSTSLLHQVSNQFPSQQHQVSSQVPSLWPSKSPSLSVEVSSQASSLISALYRYKSAEIIVQT